MIDAQSLALAAQFASPEGCRTLAGDNIPGDQPFMISRPGGAQEHSMSFMDANISTCEWLHGECISFGLPTPNQTAQVKIKPFLTPFKPKKWPRHLPTVNHGRSQWPIALLAAPATGSFCQKIRVNLQLRQLPYNPAILVQCSHPTMSLLTPYGYALCPISADGSASKFKAETRHVSRCPSTSLKVNKAKRHEKNSPIFSEHFDMKSLENQRKTVKKILQNHSKNPRILIQKQPSIFKSRCY
jgi:hypothetical protein